MKYSLLLLATQETSTNAAMASLLYYQNGEPQMSTMIYF